MQTTNLCHNTKLSNENSWKYLANKVYINYELFASGSKFPQHSFLRLNFLFTFTFVNKQLWCNFDKKKFLELMNSLGWYI